ncbi:hypothetical protein AcW1_003289 [Taiwanofungus camphoratus]|nr:hypothetical protein AcW1_003289 [Antrodia cinnamomea]
MTANKAQAEHMYEGKAVATEGRMSPKSRSKKSSRNTFVAEGRETVNRNATERDDRVEQRHVQSPIHKSGNKRSRRARRLARHAGAQDSADSGTGVSIPLEPYVTDASPNASSSSTHTEGAEAPKLEGSSASVDRSAHAPASVPPSTSGATHADPQSDGYHNITSDPAPTGNTALVNSIAQALPLNRRLRRWGAIADLSDPPACGYFPLDQALRRTSSLRYNHPRPMELDHVPLGMEVFRMYLDARKDMERHEEEMRQLRARQRDNDHSNAPSSASDEEPQDHNPADPPPSSADDVDQAERGACEQEITTPSAGPCCVAETSPSPSTTRTDVKGKKRARDSSNGPASERSKRVRVDELTRVFKPPLLTVRMQIRRVHTVSEVTDGV